VRLARIHRRGGTPIILRRDARTAVSRNEKEHYYSVLVPGWVVIDRSLVDYAAFLLDAICAHEILIIAAQKRPYLTRLWHFGEILSVSISLIVQCEILRQTAFERPAITEAPRSLTLNPE
jgi:hypothetical protein